MAEITIFNLSHLTVTLSGTNSEIDGQLGEIDVQPLRKRQKFTILLSNVIDNTLEWTANPMRPRGQYGCRNFRREELHR